MTWSDSVTLKGNLVTLEPLSFEHEPDLGEAAADGDLHALWYTLVPEPAKVRSEIERRLGLQASGSMMPFAVRSRETGKAVGMTTYMNIEQRNRRLEIGSTWYRNAVQRTGINTECKLLMLTHAFDKLGCIAVEFRTHFMNRQSRAAIERLGAKLDGILRSNQIMPNGTVRDTCVYSIIGSEWPAVRANLEWQMQRYR